MKTTYRTLGGLGAGLFWLLSGLADPAQAAAPERFLSTAFITQSTQTKESTMLKEGTLAPDFSAPTTDGSTLKLSQLRGKRVVLYFYPKDDTPGCTRQACNFRDSHAEFKKLNAVVLGVSVDSQASHQKFTEKYALPFPLIVDASKEISKKYGALNEERGNARRITYLIDAEGKVQKAYATVKPDTHAEELLAELKK